MSAASSIGIFPLFIMEKIISFVSPKDLQEIKALNRSWNEVANQVVMGHYILKIRGDIENHKQVLTKNIQEGEITNNHTIQNYKKLLMKDEQVKQLEESLNYVVHKIQQQRELRSVVMGHESLDPIKHRTLRTKILSIWNLHVDFGHLNQIFKRMKVVSNDTIQILNQSDGTDDVTVQTQIYWLEDTVDNNFSRLPRTLPVGVPRIGGIAGGWPPTDEQFSKNEKQFAWPKTPGDYVRSTNNPLKLTQNSNQKVNDRFSWSTNYERQSSFSQYNEPGINPSQQNTPNPKPILPTTSNGIFKYIGSSYL